MSLYDILRISSSADEEEIRKAYEVMIQLYNPAFFAEEKESLLRIKAKIENAYTVLSDRKLKNLYDLFLKQEEDEFVNKICSFNKQIKETDIGVKKDHTESAEQKKYTDETPKQIPDIIISGQGYSFPFSIGTLVAEGWEINDRFRNIRIRKVPTIILLSKGNDKLWIEVTSGDRNEVWAENSTAVHMCDPLDEDYLEEIDRKQSKINEQKSYTENNNSSESSAQTNVLKLVAGTGAAHCACVMRSGKLMIFGNNLRQKETENWQDIIDVSTSQNHTVGLRKNGTVITAGRNVYGECNTEHWSRVVAIAGSRNHTVGLRDNGTVVSAGYNSYGQCDVLDWKNIAAVTAGDNHTVGLKKNGTVIAVGDQYSGKCKVSDWTNITKVTAGLNHTVGLRKEGWVVATGSNSFGQCNVAGWHDIVSVSAGENHTVGLTKDGTVVATGNNAYHQCDVSSWKNIIAVCAGSNFTAALTKEGYIITSPLGVFGVSASRVI